MQTATLTEDNKKNQPLAFIISLVIYGAFLAILFFLKLMSTPLEDAEGVELNYGIDLVGTGDIQTTNKANPSPNNYDVKPAAKEEEAKPVKVKPVVTPSPAVEKPTKVKVKEAPVKPVITSKVESPVVEKEIDKPAKKVETKPVVTPTPVETKVKTEPRPEPPKPEPPKRTVDDGSLFKKGAKGSSGANGTNANSNGTIGNKDGIGGNNNGDGKKGEVGDKGKPEGKLDGNSLYGGGKGKGNGSGSGTGSGASIGGLSGWNKKKLSLPNDGSSETGKIVFKVTVDDSGDVIGISVLEATVSPSVQNFYKNYIQNKLSSVLSPEGTPPPKATGTITINIKSGN